jgi:glycosyltransferase involved in cell wall biosynthesis
MRGIPVPILFVGDCYEPNYFWACHEQAQMRRARTEFFQGIPPPGIYAYMKQALVVAQPSIYETPGLVCLEAAALGVPIAPTDRGSAREYFGDDTIYLDPFDDASMRRCLEATKTNTAKLKKTVLEQYTWKHAAKQTLAAYREFFGPWL